jgi:hypothetical protein
MSNLQILLGACLVIVLWRGFDLLRSHIDRLSAKALLDGVATNPLKMTEEERRVIYDVSVTLSALSEDVKRLILAVEQIKAKVDAAASVETVFDNEQERSRRA